MVSLNYQPPLATYTTLAYNKLPKITLINIYLLYTDHLGSIWSLISTFPGWWGGGVIIKIKGNSVRLELSLAKMEDEDGEEGV